MMSPFTHTVITASLGICLLLGWWFAWVPILLWYARYTDGWWVVLIAILVDGYYGAFYAVPYQSLLAFAIVSVFSYVRPHLFSANVSV